MTTRPIKSRHQPSSPRMSPGLGAMNVHKGNPFILDASINAASPIESRWSQKTFLSSSDRISSRGRALPKLDRGCWVDVSEPLSRDPPHPPSGQRFGFDRQLLEKGRLELSEKRSPRPSVVGVRSTALPRRRSHKPQDRHRSQDIDSDLHSVGSWCELDTPQTGSASRDDVEYDIWYPVRVPTPPRAPRIPRLPTPDLPPLATSYEFCVCHGNEKDQIKDSHYLVNRLKMEDQLEAAMAHIKATKAMAGRSLE